MTTPAIRPLLTDRDGRPIAQFWNPRTLAYEPVHGDTGAMQITSMQRKWREDFPGVALNAAEWQVIQTGAGQTITVASSELRIAAGTTIGAETILRSVRAYTIPFRTLFIFMLSQRIANQEFILEVLNSAGDMVAQWLFSGVTATIGSHNVRNGDVWGTVSSPSIASTAAMAIAEIELFPDEVYFHSRPADSTGVRTMSAARTRFIPDPNEVYFIQIRARNLGVTPASGTTLTVDAVTVQDIAEISAEITAGRGSMIGAQAIAAHITGGSVAVTGSLTSAGTVTQATAASLRSALGVATAGGMTPWSAINILAATQTVKASAGLVYGWSFFNPNAAVVYVQLHNTLSITPGTTVPLYSIPVPPGGQVTTLCNVGITHGAAIALICTTTARGGTAPGVGIDANVFFA